MKEFIDHTGVYSTCWLLFFFGTGIVTYVIDRTWFQGFYTGCYNFLHENPLAKSQGFIFGHRTSYKFVIAFFASTIQSLWLFFFTTFHSNPFIELVLWLVEVPVMVLGFAAGFWVFPWWEKRRKFYKAMDNLDDKIEARIEREHRDVKIPVVQKPEPVVATVTPPMPTVPPKPAISAEQRIADYAKK